MKVRFYCDAPLVNSWGTAMPYLHANTAFPSSPVFDGYKRIGFDVEFPAGVLEQYLPEELAAVSNVAAIDEAQSADKQEQP